MYNARIKVTETLKVTPQVTLSFSLDRFIVIRAARMLVVIAGTVGLLYLVTLLPGLILVALPGGIAAAGNVYDEARLILFLKYGDPISPGKWDEVEYSTEMTRIKASYGHDVSRQFSR